jgi:hypothetical protein
MGAYHYWYINGRRRLIDKLLFPIIAVFLLSLLLGVSHVCAQNYVSTLADSSSYALQAGALGDDASRGNMGVGANIRTHIENVPISDYDQSFWVGDNLANGAFIQFGYTLVKAGNYCLHRGPTRAPPCQSEHVDSGDARWFWQYWPKINVPQYYYGVGPAHSAGTEGTWHTYTIASNGSRGWSFVLDGRLMDEINVDVASSKNAAYVVAEVVTASPSATRNFGPVEFSNLTYYTPNEWHPVKTLTAVSGCGLNTNCNVPYVVTVVGPNHIIVTSAIKN